MRANLVSVRAKHARIEGNIPSMHVRVSRGYSPIFIANRVDKDRVNLPFAVPGEQL
jgi:hypothetical protein